jgi:hypothetical protein
MIPTPKEKARELIFSFTYLNSRNASDQSKIEHPTAICCARKVVDEIIASRNEDVRFDDSFLAKSKFHQLHPMYLSYWIQIRQEIDCFDKI